MWLSPQTIRMGEGVERPSNPDNSGVIVVLPENSWALTSQPVKRHEAKQLHGTGVTSDIHELFPF